MQSPTAVLSSVKMIGALDPTSIGTINAQHKTGFACWIRSAMAAKVFISYRRDDSAGHAGRLHDRLEREFDRNLLFMDVDKIPLGADFIDVINGEVAKCDVLLAIIGPNWIEAEDDNGNRRLDNEQDFVRLEIRAAL